MSTMNHRDNINNPGHLVLARKEVDPQPDLRLADLLSDVLLREAGQSGLQWVEGELDSEDVSGFNDIRNFRTLFATTFPCTRDLSRCPMRTRASPRGGQSAKTKPSQRPPRPGGAPHTASPGRG